VTLLLFVIDPRPACQTYHRKLAIKISPAASRLNQLMLGYDQKPLVPSINSQLGEPGSVRPGFGLIE
jgi:hypothetical protein